MYFIFEAIKTFMINNKLFLVLSFSLFSILLIFILIGILDSLKKNQFKKEQKLQDKYPSLNIFLGIFLIIFLVGLSLITLSFIINQVKNFIIWISNISKNLDAVIIVAIISGAVSTLGIVINSIVSKIIEYKRIRKDYLSKKREIPYGAFIDMIYKVQQNTKNDNSYTQKMIYDDILRFSKQITLWGSPKVVKKWIQFKELGLQENDNSINNLVQVESLMNEMRKDLGVKKVKKGNLLSFFINDIKEHLK